MCYFINVSRRRKRTVDGNPAVQVCRVIVDYKQAGDMLKHLAATSFPAEKGYVLELFREDKSCKRIEAPEPRPHVSM